ncbi:OmpA family protein [uncultured Campylobacter sp.]|uniref:OmpA family protein n=1 Tax=uncultured Campylobacter sp. TaxID=218934 RepID=UPI002609C65D|nr:OmpA family protein [uncultured Campylobacter sp.]
MKFEFIAVFVVGVLLAGCASSYSGYIPKDGVVSYSDVKFPAKDEAWIKGGIYTDKEKIKKLKVGQNKSQIMKLIGHPHFGEGFFGVVEWDYILNFTNSDKSVTTCQYKIVFDRDFVARSIFTKPVDCVGSAVVVPVVAPKIEQEEEEKELGESFFFGFGHAMLDWKERARLSKYIKSIKEIKSVEIVGYADKVGTDSYNDTLSIRRADYVKGELVRLGIDESIIKTSGKGKSTKFRTCQKDSSKDVYLKCLKANRRVNIVINQI